MIIKYDDDDEHEEEEEERERKNLYRSGYGVRECCWQWLAVIMWWPTTMPHTHEASSPRLCFINSSSSSPIGEHRTIWCAQTDLYDPRDAVRSE